MKLRAWDEMKKVMHFDFQFVKSGEDGNDWILFASDKQPTSDYDGWAKNPYFQQQLKIMRFTGLTCRDKKEIYEGDIIDCRDGKAVIIYVDTFGKFVMDFNLSGKNRLMDFQDANTCMRSVRVIGNIYQNPELCNESILEDDGGSK